MRKPKWPGAALALFLLGVLLAGAGYFAGLTAPQSYPNMSSLNSGPEGSKLLFDALSRMHSLTVSRNYAPFSRWHPLKSTILLLDVGPASLTGASKQDLAELENLANAGNRVVICLPDDADFGELNTKHAPLLKTRWGIQMYQNKGATDIVVDHDGSWQAVSGLDDTVEKQFGKGSVVIALHGDDFENESIATDASYLEEVPPLIGSHNAIVFDETHFGIEESGSIAGLARRYKLQGLIAGLLILTALFIWNQSVSFPPPAEFESKREQQVLSADARGTFAGLIGRHLTAKALIESCVTEWNRVKHQQQITADLPNTANPVESYRQLQENLPKRSRRL